MPDERVSTLIAGPSRDRSAAQFRSLYDSPSSRRWWDVGSIAAIAIVCAIRASYRGLPVLRHGVDLMVALDGAWRVLNGQRPHVDFYSALGPLSSWITAFGLMLTHNAVQGINYGTAILAFVIGLWSFAIARSRQAPPWAALTSVFCTLLIVAPVPIGEPFSSISDAMFYNRYGYALLVLILLEAYSSPRQAAPSLTGGLSTGLACCLLLFLKASYFFIGAGMIVVLLGVRRQDRARIAGITVAFAVTLTAILGYLGFHVGVIMHDLSIAAGARAERMRLLPNFGLIGGTLVSNFSLILLGVLAGFAAWHAKKDSSERMLVWGRYIIGAVLVAGAGAAVLFSNYQPGGVPLNGAFAIVLADEGIRSTMATKRPINFSRNWLYALFAVWALWLCLPFTAVNGRALLFGWRESRVASDSTRVHAIHSSVMNDLRMMGASIPWTTGKEYADTVNDGIDLLARWSPASETVYSLAFVNPFSYALQRKPALGGSTWLHAMYNFSDSHKPSAEWLLGHVDVVMVPKAQGQFISDYILRNYLGYVTSRFHLVAESGKWWMYRKNPPAQ